jgi:hypothetical protein
MNTVDKLLSKLPSSWFSDSAKTQGGILYALLKAFANGLDYVEAGAAYVKAQTRIGTATDDNLEKIAFDFFGDNFDRRSGEPDESYRSRIIQELFRDKVTRQAIIDAVESLGCQVVEFYEPWIDGFFPGYSYTDHNRLSNNNPYEAIIFVKRPLDPTVTAVLFTDYNYTDNNYIPVSTTNIYTIQDDDIFDIVEAVKAAGIRIWVVLDPIPLSDTEAMNRISVERYYIPPITT